MERIQIRGLKFKKLMTQQPTNFSQYVYFKKLFLTLKIIQAFGRTCGVQCQSVLTISIPIKTWRARII